MDISAAALSPIQPAISKTDEAHPRFREYLSYRASMTCLLVTAASFESWLGQTEDRERPKTVVFLVDWRDIPESEKPEEALANGWWKHEFAPGHKLVRRVGPFATQHLAEAA